MTSEPTGVVEVNGAEQAPARPRVKSAKAKKATASAPKPSADAARRKPASANGERRPPRPTSAKPASKTASVLKLLRTGKGTTVDGIMAATGWQAHSVRGFLSATVRKKLGLALVSDVGKDGTRRYKVTDPAKAA